MAIRLTEQDVISHQAKHGRRNTQRGGAGNACERAGVGEALRAQIKLIQQRKPREQNQNEKSFASEVLYWQKLRGEIADYTHEVQPLKLANGCTYRPDFLVTPITSCRCSCGITFPHRLYYELKGEKRTRKGRRKTEARQAGVVKIKVAAGLYPHYKFVLAWKEGGEWLFQEVLP